MNYPAVPIPVSQNDPRRVMPGRGTHAPYINPVLPGQVPAYGVSPGVGYGVAPGGLGQSSYAGLGQAGLGQAGMAPATNLPPQHINPGLASTYYNQPMQQQPLQSQAMQTPMDQGVASGTTPGAAAAGASTRPPNTTGADQYAQPNEHLRHHSHHRDEHHRIRDILRDLLAGTALAAIAEHHHRKKHRDASPDKTVNPQQPPSQQPLPVPPHVPHGSALGFLHPKGHFVPASLENMIEHFIQGHKEKGIAPDGARPGYLHTGGHFIPAGMEHLIQEFKHTLLYGPGSRHHRTGKRWDRGGSPSPYSGSESYSD